MKSLKQISDFCFFCLLTPSKAKLTNSVHVMFHFLCVHRIIIA